MYRRSLLTGLVAAPLVASAATLGGCSRQSATPEPTRITSTDARGRLVTLEQTVDKVVALDWTTAENLLLLGLAPVAMPRPDAFAKACTATKLIGKPADLGATPTAAEVAKLGAQLVLGTPGLLDDAALAELEKSVPVLVQALPGATPVADLRANLDQLGAVTGRSREAAAVSLRLDEANGRARTKLAGHLGEPLVLVELTKDAATVWTAHTAPMAAAVQMGLADGWPATAADRARVPLDEAVLAKLPATTRVRWFSSDPKAEAPATWAKLPQAKRVRRVPVGINLAGGVASLAQWIDDLATHS